MRPLILSALVGFFCLVPVARADSIVQVNLFATLTATNSCTSNCTEFINIGFQFDQTLVQDPRYPLGVPVGILPGTMSVLSGGFMGAFAWTGITNFDQGYIPFVNGSGAVDEFDIDFYTIFPDLTFFKPGIYDASGSSGSGVGTELFLCRTAECQAAFGNTRPTANGLFVILPVPENGGPQIALLGLATCAGGIALKCKRRSVSAG